MPRRGAAGPCQLPAVTSRGADAVDVDRAVCVRYRRLGACRGLGLIEAMQRGEIWFAATPGGDRPVLKACRALRDATGC
jgi:hypothetical protein